MFKHSGSNVPAHGLALTLLLFTGPASAGDNDKNNDKNESSPVVEVGVAADQSVTSADSGFGPKAAVEFTVIENWLSVGPGVTTKFSAGKADVSTDFLFKKPFEISSSFEFEPGIGPVWIHTLHDGKTTDDIGAEAVLSFLFWPTEDRKLGWFLQPSYTFVSSHDQSIGVSAGLLIPIQ